MSVFSFKNIFLMVLTGITLFSIMLRVGDGLVLGFRDDNWKPLADATIGEFLGSQAMIIKDISYIKENPSADSSNIQMSKDRILRSTILSLFMIYLVWLVIRWVFVGLSQNKQNIPPIVNIGALIIALIIIYLTNILYLGFTYDTWNFIPLPGFSDPKNGLIANVNILWESFGSYNNPWLNSSVNKTVGEAFGGG